MNIQLTAEIQNTSLQVGDYIYYIPVNMLNTLSGQKVGENPTYVGKVLEINSNWIKTDNTVNIPSGSFLMFSKDTRVNNSSLKGYYANVKLKHEGNDAAELFSVSSEATESSK